MEFDVLQPENAPEAARTELEKVKEQYGFVPNFFGVMANAPPALIAYRTLNRLFDETTLLPLERQVVILACSVANRCEYCVSAHSAAARSQNVPAEIVDAIREEQSLSDRRLEALCLLTTQIVAQRGWPKEEAIDEFLAAGFAPHQVLEVLLGVAMKTLSNYTNHIADTPLDSQFAGAEWSASATS
jgi:uncharacterized peroxidase-related enzyme